MGTVHRNRWWLRIIHRVIPPLNGEWGALVLQSLRLINSARERSVEGNRIGYCFRTVSVQVNMRVGLGAIFTLILTAACSDASTGPVEFSHEGIRVVSLPSTILSASPVLGVPVSIGVAGQNVVVSDMLGAPYIHVFDTESGQLRGSLGRRGEGPADFLTAPTILGEAPNLPPNVQVYDEMNQRITTLDLRSLRVPDSTWPVAPIWGLVPQGIQDVSPADTNEIMATVFSSSGLTVRRYSQIAGVQDTLGVVDLADARLPVAQMLAAYTHHLCTQSAGRRFAILYHYAGRIDMFEASTSHPINVKIPFPYLPHLEPNPISRALGFKSGAAGVRRGYVGCASTNKYLFALFRGRLRGKRGKGNTVDHIFVHIFDWDGSLLKVVRLDHAAIAIAVDPAARFLYSITLPEDPGPIALRRTKLMPLQ